jgi:integrase
LGALFGYAQEDEGALRELALMLATACRPGVALAFDPESQWHDKTLDLQPEDRDETDKRNAVVPVIAPLCPILEDWKANPHPRVKSRKRWWGTAKNALNMPGVEAYDIRHTVTTFMDNEGVPGAQFSGIAGHMPASRNVARTTAEHYLHYDPENAPQAERALSKLFRLVQTEAKKWTADHLRTIGPKGNVIVVARKEQKC